MNTDELGERVGVSGVAITKIETGQTQVSESTMWTILKIALELSTDFDEPVIREHLEVWTPRIEQAWDIVNHGPHDFGEGIGEGAAQESLHTSDGQPEGNTVNPSTAQNAEPEMLPPVHVEDPHKRKRKRGRKKR